MKNRGGMPASLAIAALGLVVLGVPVVALAQAACIGDCNSDGQVTWRELVLAGDRAVGKSRNCPSADANSDGQVQVEEVVRAVSNLHQGCVPPATRTPTPTRTRLQTATATRSPTPVSVGPVVTYFGIARADGTIIDPSDVSGDGTPIFSRVVGAGFLIVVEARPGTSGSPVSTITSGEGTQRPDIQIQSNRDLGNGSSLVCDIGPIREGLPLGGVPGIAPTSFDPESQTVTDALNDFGCRFSNSTGNWCTFDAGENSSPVTPGELPDLVQFCTDEVIGVALHFDSGDTRLTVQLRDFESNIGSPASIIVRVP